MRRDSLTQWHLRKHPEKISRFDKVVIWSGEHRLYWRPGYCGYTGDILEAGVYDARDALAHTIHCDPEKKIVLIVAPANIQQQLQPDNGQAVCQLTKCYADKQPHNYVMRIICKGGKKW